MGVAGLSLDPVGHVEREPGARRFIGAGRHEALEVREQRFVSLEQRDGVTSGLERAHDLADAALAVGFRTGRAEAADHAVAGAVADERDLHARRAPTSSGRLASAGTRLRAASAGPGLRRASRRHGHRVDTTTIRHISTSSSSGWPSRSWSSPGIEAIAVRTMPTSA